LRMILGKVGFLLFLMLAASAARSSKAPLRIALSMQPRHAVWTALNSCLHFPQNLQ
jgi:hypothetical protein